MTEAKATGWMVPKAMEGDRAGAPKPVKRGDSAKGRELVSVRGRPGVEGLQAVAHPEATWTHAAAGVQPRARLAELAGRSGAAGHRSWEPRRAAEVQAGWVAEFETRASVEAPPPTDMRWGVP